MHTRQWLRTTASPTTQRARSVGSSSTVVKHTLEYRGDGGQIVSSKISEDYLANVREFPFSHRTRAIDLTVTLSPARNRKACSGSSRKFSIRPRGRTSTESRPSSSAIGYGRMTALFGDAYSTNP